jgi:hypothetical protein
MAESAVPKVPRDGTLVIKDGTTPTANEYTVQYSDAVSITDTQTAAIHIYNRGTRVYTRQGNTAIPTISFNVIFTAWTDGTDGSIIDAMKGEGAFSSWTKVLTNVEHFNTTAVFTTEGTDFGDDVDGTATCTGLRLVDTSFSEGEPNTLTINCEILGTITYTGGP